MFAVGCSPAAFFVKKRLVSTKTELSQFILSSSLNKMYVFVLKIAYLLLCLM